MPRALHTPRASPGALRRLGLELGSAANLTSPIRGPSGWSPAGNMDTVVRTLAGKNVAPSVIASSLQMEVADVEAILPVLKF